MTDKSAGSTAADWLEVIHPTELMPSDLEDRVSFEAVLPSTASAIRFHGDCGARITLDIDDGVHNEGVEQVKRLIDWRGKVLRVTVRPVSK